MPMFFLKKDLCMHLCMSVHACVDTYMPRGQRRVHLVSITLSFQGRVCLSGPGASFLCPSPTPQAEKASKSHNPPASTPLGVFITSVCGMLGLMPEG